MVVVCLQSIDNDDYSGMFVTMDQQHFKTDEYSFHQMEWLSKRERERDRQISDKCL